MPRPTTSPTASPDAPAREREDVVPVAAEAAARRGQVARVGLEPERLAELAREQPPLQHLGDVPLLVQAGALDRARRALAGELQQGALVLVELRGVRLPTWSTPIASPPASSGTPSSDSIPFSRRIGL